VDINGLFISLVDWLSSLLYSPNLLSNENTMARALPRCRQRLPTESVASLDCLLDEPAERI
jgi:hypothetical protein